MVERCRAPREGGSRGIQRWGAHLVWRCGGWEAGGATVGRGPTTEIEGPEDRGLTTGNPLEFGIMFTRIQNTDQWDRGPTTW